MINNTTPAQSPKLITLDHLASLVEHEFGPIDTLDLIADQAAWIDYYFGNLTVAIGG